MVNELKKNIRKQIQVLKSQISFEEKCIRSEKILNKLEIHQGFKNARCIIMYWSMSDEVQTKDFIIKWADKKEIILPSVQGDVLVLRKFAGVENLETGSKYGIQEPKGEDFIDFRKIELIIVPGVAFDKKNNRLGRGKAYYDKLLKDIKAYKIAICFDFQFLDFVPTDEFDVKMDEIITE